MERLWELDVGDMEMWHLMVSEQCLVSRYWQGQIKASSSDKIMESKNIYPNARILDTPVQ